MNQRIVLETRLQYISELPNFRTAYSFICNFFSSISGTKTRFRKNQRIKKFYSSWAIFL